jgi:hypothetical protein
MLISILEVPIYDARTSGFTFSADDIGCIKDLPLYKKGYKDLPQDAVVTVGYTAGTFVYQTSQTALALNLMFVILLGIPLSPDTDISYNADKKGKGAQRVFM